MELKVIGSGSKGNGYILECENEALIIEAGCKLIEVKKAIDFNLEKIKGCIITHDHNDHAVFAPEYSESGITVLALPEVIRSREITRNFKTIEFGKSYDFGGFKVYHFSVHHDVNCVGYVIDHAESGRIVFLTDTFSLEYNIHNVNHYLIEANYSDEILNQNVADGIVPRSLAKRIVGSHLEINNTIKILQRSDLSQTKNIVLIHLSDGNSDEKLFIEQCQKATGKHVKAAKAGMRLNLDREFFIK